MKKKRPFVPVATPGTKGHPLLSRTGVPGWETGTTAVSQPGQINVFVVVAPIATPKSKEEITHFPSLLDLTDRCSILSSHLQCLFVRTGNPQKNRHGTKPAVSVRSVPSSKVTITITFLTVHVVCYQITTLQ